MDEITLVIAALLILLVSAFCSFSKVSKLPGPWTNSLPIIGSLPIMTDKPFLKLTELSKKYGPMYRLRIGSMEVVVMTDYETIKEAFAKDAFLGRPPDVDLHFNYGKETKELDAISGLPWKEQRRFSLHMLRDVGFGKTRMEELMKEEIQELLQKLSEHEGKPLMPSLFLSPSMSNNIVSLLFGKRLKYDDPQRQKLDYLVVEYGRLNSSITWHLFFPWLKAFMRVFNIGDTGKFLRVIAEEKKYCRKEILEHEATLDSSNIRDFVDGYLLEIQKKEANPSSAFRKGVLEDLARTFFSAGSDSVRATLDWMLLVCAAFPEVQRRIHSEIDEVLGQDRFPTGQDRLDMPFTEAAMLELMRWRTVLPMTVLRYALKDTELKGHFIPKNTRFVSVLWAVDHDTKLWGNDVHEYKPERFLSEDGKKVVKREYFASFSFGKRSCPGRPLAEVQVFLYLVCILQAFQVRPPPGKEIDLEGEPKLVFLPKMQELCFKRRSKGSSSI